ncbi:hypothetical protein KIPE111705_20500 [Kibdelosporangium persicum]|uniref:YbaB/EbfC DNA-binding family protein n=1 Tax=Kibdelosporangium persicum TaxID=2698649 RepID=A0ABX2FG04_9PSEU|nr:hypothetical protein [Kibdelosporangium persicum]NRN70064.1 hypothetical protein [Kibdelosporangium persicum]
MAEKPKPTPAFSAPAAGLAPVAGQVQETKRKAEVEGLTLDPAAASALLATVARLRERVDDLVVECADLDQPLKFGANFVGRTVADRLQHTASGGNSSVTPVLTAFSKVLADLQSVIQVASGRYLVTDEDAAKKLRTFMSPFGLEAR